MLPLLTTESTKINYLCHMLMYTGVLQQDPMPKLCFIMVLTSCKDFFADCKDFFSRSYRYELSQVDTSGISACKHNKQD